MMTALRVPDDQAGTLESILRTNRVAGLLLDRLPELGLPGWYLGAGAVAQTVWNHGHGFAPDHGIEDYDVVYFEAGDLTAAGERAVGVEVEALATGAGAPLDVTNQARVHLWYERRFGRPLAPYPSAEAAIASWPTTATSVGVRRDEGGRFEVWAPFGLTDLFGLVVRPNTALVGRAVYEAKAERWRRLWPRLTVLPWP